MLLVPQSILTVLLPVLVVLFSFSLVSVVHGADISTQAPVIGSFDYSNLVSSLPFWC